MNGRGTPAPSVDVDTRPLPAEAGKPEKSDDFIFSLFHDHHHLGAHVCAHTCTHTHKHTCAYTGGWRGAGCSGEETDACVGLQRRGG